MRPLVFASLVSNVGTSTALLAVAWVSYQYGGSIVHTVMVATAYSVPAVVLGPLAGRLADTRDHRHVVVAAYVSYMLVWNGLTALYIAGTLNPAWLTLAMVVAGSAGALDYPSWQELKRGLVPDARLHEANGVFASLRAVARVVGAVGGGFIIAWAGAGTMFAFNALSFLPLALVVARQPHRRVLARPPTARSIGMRQTIAYVRSEESVRLAIGMIAVLTLLAVPIVSLLPAVAGEMRSDAHVLGVLIAVYSVGGSLVVAVLHRLSDDYPKVRLVEPIVIGCGASLTIIGVLGDRFGGPGRLVGIVGLLLPIGLGLAMAQAVLLATVQLCSAPGMQGRVLGFYRATVSVVTPIGGLALATVTELTSVWLSVAVAGVLLFAVAIALRVVRPVALAATDAKRHHGLALEHARHLRQFVVGFIQPGQLHFFGSQPDDEVEAAEGLPIIPPPTGSAAPQRAG